MTKIQHSHHSITLHWRHNGRDGVSNHQAHDCLLNRLFRCRSEKTSKLCVISICAGNSPMTGKFPIQMVSNADNVPFDDVIMRLPNNHCPFHTYAIVWNDIPLTVRISMIMKTHFHMQVYTVWSFVFVSLSSIYYRKTTLCRELVCITVKWTLYYGRDKFFHITSGRINTWKGWKNYFFLI